MSSMTAKKFENEYTQLWKKIEGMSEGLQKIYWDNWDETGRPKNMNTEVNAINSILRKNGEAGYAGFKLDMNTLFEKEEFTEKQLSTYYQVFLGGVQYIADKLNESSALPKKNKP